LVHTFSVKQSSLNLSPNCARAFRTTSPEAVMFALARFAVDTPEEIVAAGQENP
jgi:hypothetical protein